LAISQTRVLTLGTDWDSVGIDWDVPLGDDVGTDWDEVGTNWDERRGGASESP